MLHAAATGRGTSGFDRPNQDARVDEVTAITLARARTVAERGQHLLAADLLRGGLDERVPPVYLELLVQELCRADDVRAARGLFERTRLADEASIEGAALGGRICKDEAALMPPGAERNARFAEASGRYASAQAQSRRAGINAATTAWLAGDRARALQHARAVLAMPRTGGYFDAAARGEAWLVLGALAKAARAFEEASRERPTLADVATTRRQILLMVAMNALSARDAETALAALRQGRVVHYCGQMGTPEGGIASFSPDEVAAIRARVERTLAAEDVGVAYGGLASGGDLLVAECVLDAHAELQLVLPFPVESYRRVSVERFGRAWAERFDGLLPRATDVVIASDLDYAGDDRSFDFGTKLAMGLALQRARHLVTPCLQLAVFDGRSQRPRPVGTEANLRYWHALGQRSIVFTAAGEDERAPGPPPSQPRPMLLARIGGFQALRGGELPWFLDHVLGALAGVLDTTGSGALWRAVWGDGMLAAFSDEAAAERGLENLRRALPAEARARTRFGLHLDPLPAVADPVLASASWFGRLGAASP